MNKQLKIIPLGGLGEVGKNMTVLEYGRNQIIIDCGVMFPESDLHGIDLVLPQFDYIVQNQGTLRGVVLTHGHQDHIGGLPYLLKRLQPVDGGLPVFGTGLTIGMVGQKMEEMGVSKSARLQVIDDKQTIQLGPFRISPFAVAHSIPAAVGLVIDTPVGALVHTGDYKLDETPSGGRTTDFERLRQLTPNGVLAMLGDSTNADKPGRTPTERLVADTLDELIAQSEGKRIIIATFSSLLARIQEIIHLADKYHRKLILAGRSLQTNVELANRLGYLQIPDGLIIDAKKTISDSKVIILATGSQGEPRSALNLMALGEHRQVQVKSGDTIIVSGGAIPGNEEDIGRMLNHLFARGANVIYGALATVHVSGHANREDMRIMLQKVNPRFLLPVHGELRHQHLHANLAQETGIKKENVFILQNGSSWITDGEKAWLGAPIPAADVYVDGLQVGDIGEQVILDRGQLAQDGVIVVNVPINKQRKLAGKPYIVTRGFSHTEEADALIEAALVEIRRGFQHGKNQTKTEHLDVMQKTLQKTLQDFFYRKTQSRPVILSNLIKV